MLNASIHKVNSAQNAHFYMPERLLSSSQLQVTYDTKIRCRVNLSFVFNPEELFCDLSEEQDLPHFLNLP